MKSRDILFVVLALVLVGAGLFSYMGKGGEEIKTSAGFPDGTFMVEGKAVTLVDGQSIEAVAPVSASKIITKYFGNDIEIDLNGDGTQDRAFLITQETGGSGTFFYVVALVNTSEGKKGTDAVFIGDRIAPQNLGVKNGNILIVNYADRKPEESFDVDPSVGKSVYLKLNPQTFQFGEVVADFEGETNPSVMKLDMKTWKWVETLYKDGRKITPYQDRFSLTFKGDRVTIGTDCNQGVGTFTSTKDTISITNIITTEMLCEVSQEREFLQMLENSMGYHFTSKGELILSLKYDSGSVIFR